jgi:AICAR transformylase/IMP cyclohydrolase PurH
MARQVLTDGTARYFDRKLARKYEEDTRWNGNNHVSVATGDQYAHESLYRTKSGLWVIHHWSQWQGSTESWEQISDAQAAAWLVTNGHESHRACAAEYAALDLDAVQQ